MEKIGNIRSRITINHKELSIVQPIPIIRLGVQHISIAGFGLS